MSYPSGTEFGGSSGGGGGWSEGGSDSGAEADDEASGGSDWGGSDGHTGLRFSQRRWVPVARVMLGSHVSSLGRLILQMRIQSLIRRRKLNKWGFDVLINTPNLFTWERKW